MWVSVARQGKETSEMKWFKKLIHDAVHNYDTTMEGADIRHLYDKKTGARNTPAEEMLAQMASSIAVVFRIDNGFMVGINMNTDIHMGQRGKLLYAKDANEVGALMVGHEAAFKIGSRSGLGALTTDKYTPSGGGPGNGGGAGQAKLNVI